MHKIEINRLHESCMFGGGGGDRCHNLKNGKKPVKLQKKNPAGCAGECNQSKQN